MSTAGPRAPAVDISLCAGCPLSPPLIAHVPAVLNSPVALACCPLALPLWRVPVRPADAVSCPVSRLLSGLAAERLRCGYLAPPVRAVPQCGPPRRCWCCSGRRRRMACAYIEAPGALSLGFSVRCLLLAAVLLRCSALLLCIASSSYLLRGREGERAWVHSAARVASARTSISRTTLSYAPMRTIS
jgi:hypothetical protein